MKILLINNFTTQTGGAEKYVFQLEKLYKVKGHQVFLYSTNREPLNNINPEYSELFPEYIDYKKSSTIQKISKLFQLFYNFQAEKNLEKMIRAISPDIVHMNCINYHLTPSIIKACKRNNIPIVMTLHDARLFCPSGTLMRKNDIYCDNKHCLSSSPLNCLMYKCKNKSLSQSLIVTLEALLNKIHRLYDSVDCFVCPSLAMYNLALESGIAKSRLKHINNFLDTELIEKKANYSNKGYFLFVGRLVKEKGVKYLLEAMQSIPEIHLKIAGNGEEENKLVKMATELNLKNVEFVGFKCGKDLENLYKNCMATILPCNYFETFGLSIIESFAYGKSVVASRIGAIPELIKEDVNGYTFSPTDSRELSNLLNKLFYNQDLVYHLSVNAKQAAYKYNPENFYSDIISVYSKLTERKIENENTSCKQSFFKSGRC